MAGIQFALTHVAESGRLKMIESAGGFSFKRVGPPQPQDLYSAMAVNAEEALGQVESSVVDAFRPHATTMLSKLDEGQVASIVAAALAVTAGVERGLKVSKMLAGRVLLKRYLHYAT